VHRTPAIPTQDQWFPADAHIEPTSAIPPLELNTHSYRGAMRLLYTMTKVKNHVDYYIVLLIKLNTRDYNQMS
jgi:homoserine kinase